jgi:hypothetical protein
MRVYVTGASGFVGAHVAAALREQGAELRHERVDLLDPPALERAVDGCEVVVHVAARYTYEGPAEVVERVNVKGTCNVIEACLRRGVRRLVHTSTAGTCGPVPGRPATEEDTPPHWELTVPYKASKLRAEQHVLAAARSALDAVVVNPTTPIGICLARRRQIPRPAPEVAPRAVVPLPGANSVRCAFRRRPVANAEELPQQQILGVHGDVGLELALPPSFGVLEREEVRPCSLQRDDFTRGGRDALDDPRRSRYLAGEGTSPC